jgi:hypothetical protein
VIAKKHVIVRVIAQTITRREDECAMEEKGKEDSKARVPEV